MGISRYDRFKLVVEHLCNLQEIDTLEDHFRRPDRPDNMWMPVLASIPIDHILRYSLKGVEGIGLPISCQKDMAFMIRIRQLGKDNGAPEGEIVFKPGDE